MHSEVLHQHAGQRTFLVVLAAGEDAVESLRRFAESEGLSAAQVTAIGAFERVRLQFFEWETKTYRPIPVEQQTEVASLVGDIALDADGRPSLHLHAVLGKPDGAALAGHLASAVVRPTLEVVVTETPGHLHRCPDPRTGLALIRPGAGR